MSYKRISLVVAFLFAVAAALPLVGNRIVTSALIEQVALLEKNGVRVIEHTEQSSYLKSMQVWHFRIEDANALRRYVAANSRGDFYSVAAGAIEGAQIGVDVAYSNLPFMADVVMKVYSNGYVSDISTASQGRSAVLQPLLAALMQNETLVTEINYDILSGSFNGHCNSLDETVTLHTGEQVVLKLDGVRFSGVGSLLMPEQFDFQADEMAVVLHDQREGSIAVDIGSFVSTGDIKADTEVYSSTVSSMAFSVPDANGTPMKASFDGVNMHSSLERLGQKVTLYSKSSLEKAQLSAAGESLTMKELVLDMAVRDVDRAAYESLIEIAKKAKADPGSQLQVMSAVDTLLQQGLTVEVSQLSLEHVGIGTSEMMPGFEHDAHIELKPGFKALEAMLGGFSRKSGIELTVTLRFSKPLYEYLSTKGGLQLADTYAMEEGGKVLFRINNQSDRITINDKPL